MPFNNATQETIALDATRSTRWVTWDGGSLSFRVAFDVADAVGAVQVDSYPGNAIGFKDEDDTTRTTLAVSSALNGLTHEFVIASCPRGRYRVTYTSTSDGSADSATVTWH